MRDSSGKLPVRQFRGASSIDRKVTHPLPEEEEDTYQPHQPAHKKGEGWGRRTVEYVLLLMIIAIFIYGVFAAFNSATIAINVFIAIATGLALLIALISVSKGLLDDLCTLLDTPTYYFCHGVWEGL
jgi:Flp pilus assembly protein TadB